MNREVLHQIQALKRAGRKAFATLVDPDKLRADQATDFARRANAAQIDFIFVGGSLLMSDNFDDVVGELKRILFNEPKQRSLFG